MCGPLLTGIPAAWQPFRSALGVGANDPCLLLSSVSCKRTVSTTRYGVPLQRSCLFSPCNTLFSSLDGDLALCPEHGVKRLHTNG